MAGEDEFHDDNPPPPPPLVTPTQQAPHTLLTIKLPILKKEKEKEKQSIPEDHLAKFHKMTDAKDMCEAIKSRFGAEDEQDNFALMAYNNQANTKVTSLFHKNGEESMLSHKTLYDEQREQTGMRSIEIQAYIQALKKSKTSESAANTSDSVSCESNSSVETLESVPKPAVNEPKAVSKPKVWSDAPIIEEYESDSDDEYVIKPSKEQEKPSFAFVNTVKHVKTLRETIKEQNTCSPSPKADKRDWNV
ncbi:hypothetical protein Tco_0430948 [Tanacetum coccineum]